MTIKTWMEHAETVAASARENGLDVDTAAIQAICKNIEITDLRARVAELEAKIEAHNAYWRQVRQDCIDAAGGPEEHGDDDECEMCGGMDRMLIDTEARNG